MDHRHSVYNTHAKLLASELVSLDYTTSPFSRAEATGTVVSREIKAERFLKFELDDGTGCVPCVLWLNHLARGRGSPEDVRLTADAALRSGEAAVVGAVATVRGRITRYRGQAQITVSDVVAERDPNAEILHWLDCLRLARRRYGALVRK